MTVHHIDLSDVVRAKLSPYLRTRRADQLNLYLHQRPRSRKSLLGLLALGSGLLAAAFTYRWLRARRAAAPGLAPSSREERGGWPSSRALVTGQASRPLLVFTCSPSSKSGKGPNMGLASADAEAAGISRHIPATYYRGGTAGDLSAALLEQPTRRFVFIGHGDLALSGQRATLGFTTADGGLCAVDALALSRLLGECAPSSGGLLELVMLQGCCTLQLGRGVLAAGVPYVICWSTLTEDGACAIFSAAFFEHYAHAQRQSSRSGNGGVGVGVGGSGGGGGGSGVDCDGTSLAYLRAFDHAVNAVTLKTRPGRTDTGLELEVPKYELRDPSVPTRQTYRPKPWAAGLPVLLTPNGEEFRGDSRLAVERIKSL